jgi:hypothetical protein
MGILTNSAELAEKTTEDIKESDPDKEEDKMEEGKETNYNDEWMDYVQ